MPPSDGAYGERVAGRSGRRRRGSPWTGLGAVVAKETADHLSGALIVLVQLLTFLAALFAVYGAIQAIRAAIGQNRFLFLLLMTVVPPSLPFSFVDLLGILVPVFAIVLGFDAINGELNRRTMSRLLGQPIYRDALLLGKFLAGLLAMTIALVSLWLLVIGLGLLYLGVPPSTEETVRMLGFLLATIAYGGVWLAVALLFSVLFRAPAAAVLAALGLWLVFLLFWSVIAKILTTAIVGSPDNLSSLISYAEMLQTINRVSPNFLFAEIAEGLLSPGTHGFGLLSAYTERLQGTLPTALPVSQSFLLIWPQLTGLIAATIALFVAAYIAFQRQEIRA